MTVDLGVSRPTDSPDRRAGKAVDAIDASCKNGYYGGEVAVGEAGAGVIAQRCDEGMWRVTTIGGRMRAPNGVDPRRPCARNARRAPGAHHSPRRAGHRRGVRRHPVCAGRCGRRSRCRGRCADAIRRRRQVRALDLRVPGLAVRCRRRRRGAASGRQLRAAARVRPAAGRRDGRLPAAPRPAVGTRRVRPVAPRPRAVRIAGAFRRIGGGAARRPVSGVGRADVAGKRRWTPRRCRRAWPQIRRDAHRTRGRPVRRPRQRCRRIPDAGPGAGRVPPQIGQLHGAPAAGDRRRHGRMRSSRR